MWSCKNMQNTPRYQTLRTNRPDYMHFAAVTSLSVKNFCYILFHSPKGLSLSLSLLKVSFTSSYPTLYPFHILFID